MLKTYIVSVKYFFIEEFKIDAHNENDALITYDEGESLGIVVPQDIESCKIKRVKS